MSKVVLFFAMSLDGFIAGPDISSVHPMGIGGERLHRWMFENVSPIDMERMREPAERVGAVIVGRRTYDVGIDLWGDTPYPVPTFVLTNEKRDLKQMKSAAFTFVNDGIGSALRQAQMAAGAKDIMLMGANTAQQFIQAGLVDEMILQIVPVLLGAGSRLFDHIGSEMIELEIPQVVASPAVTHLKFIVRKP